MMSKAHSQEDAITLHVCLKYKDIISEKCLEKATKVRDYIIDK